MSELIIATTLRETIATIAAAICTVWQADADTPAVYAEQCRTHDADLSLSLMAHRPDGQFVGVAVLARRGQRGFVLDFGIAPDFRKQGYGHRLFAAVVESLRGAGVRQASLIVNADNNAAIRIYEQAGFHASRELITLRGRTAERVRERAEAVSGPLAVDAVSAWCGEDKAARPIWERDLPSLVAMANVQAFHHAHGFMLTRPSPYHRQVDIVHLGLLPEATVAHVAALCHAATSVYGERLPLALPEEPRGSRAHQIMHQLGFKIVERAFEMTMAF